MATLTRLLILANVVVYASYAYLAFFNAGMTSFKPLYWYVITMVSGLTVFFMNPAGITGIPRSVFVWLWIFALQSILMFTYSSQTDIAVQAVIYRFETIALLLSFLLLFQGEPGVAAARWTLVGVVLFGAVMNMVDFFDPVWTNVAGRAAGLYLNPNTAGTVLVLGLIATIGVIPKPLRLAYSLIVSAGVMLTVSRGSWMLLAMALTGMAGTGYLVFRRRLAGAILIGATTLFLVVGLLSGFFLHVLDTLGLAGYLTPNTFDRLGGAGQAFRDDSAASRAGVAALALQAFQDHPWLGYGLGYTSEWHHDIDTHNVYLTLLVQGGIFGVAVFVWLLVMLWRITDGLGKVLVVVFSVSCFFSHNALEQPAMLVFIALVIAASTQRSPVESLTRSDSARAPAMISGGGT